MTCRDAQDSIWTSSITIPVAAPIISYVDKVVDDSGQSRPNGKVDPGETAELIVVLANQGLGNAYDVSAILRSGDSRFTIDDSVGTFGTILVDSLGNNDADRFTVTASIFITPETDIPCTLYITAANGYTTKQNFTIMAGGITTVDPIPDGPRTPPLYFAYDDVDTYYSEHPTYERVEIKTLGTRLTMSDDQTYTITLPSSFGPWKFYGQRYTQLSICSNGWVGPGSQTANAYNNKRLPNPTANYPNGMVCADWDDLLPNNSGVGGVYYYHDAVNHQFVIEYDSVPYLGATSYMDKSEIIIYDTTMAAADGHNEIFVQYMTANRWNFSTAGIEDPANQIAICCLFNDTLHRGCAAWTPHKVIKYTTDPPFSDVEDLTKTTPMNQPLVIQPTPFRNEMQVRYQLKEAGKVAMQIYDATGRLVYDMANQHSKPGIYSINWNGKDNQGRKLAAGIYFFKLQTPSEQYLKKLIRLK